MRRLRDIAIVIVVVGVYGAAMAALNADALGSVALQDTDDMLRMVQAQDLIGGQPWGDLTQHRMLPPEGVPMHWTRHMDVLVAPLMAVAGPTTAAIAVPLLLLAALGVALVSWWATQPGRSDRFLLLIAVLSTALVLSQFSPGRVDHHGLQILLAVVGSLALLRGRWATGGAFLGSSLAVGLDVLPAAVGLLVALGIGWVHAPERWSPALRRVPFSLTMSTILGTLVFAPDGRLWSSACDVASLPIVAALVVASVGAAVTAGSRRLPTRRSRLVAISGVGVAAGAAVAAIRPSCLSGPLADLPPDVASRWLAHVTEAKSLGALAASRPLLALSLLTLPLVGLAMMAVVGRRGDDRWIPTAGLTAGATLAVTLHVRAAPMAMAMALPALGVLVTMVRSRRWPADGVIQPLMVVGALLVSVAAPFTVADSAFGGRVEPTSVQLPDCSGSDRLADLAAEAPGVVLAHLDLGPAILFHTGHAVVAGPYHRNAEGIRASFDLLDGPTDGTDLAAAGIGLVAVCPGQPGNGLYMTSGDGSLMARLLAGEPVDGLQKLDGGPLLVSRVIAQP